LQLGAVMAARYTPSSAIENSFEERADMYRNFYHLKCAPFAAIAHPEPLFLSTRHQTALQQVLEGLGQRQGMIALIGAAGLGKTTLLRAVLAQQPQNQFKTIYLDCASLASDKIISHRDLIKHIYQELGYSAGTKSLADIIDEMQNLFIADGKSDINTAIVLDNAHFLSSDALITLPQIISIFPYKEKFAQIVLVGQPLLENKLNHPKLQWFKHYLETLATLEPLNLKESRTYIKSRLRQAAATDRAIFSAGTITAIAKHAQGIPRNLNILCTDVLISGFQHHKQPIPTRIARQVITEFENNSAYRPTRLRWLSAVAAVLLASIAILFVTGQLQTLSRTPQVMLQLVQPHLQRLASLNMFTKDDVEPPVVVRADAPIPTPSVHPETYAPKPARTAVSPPPPAPPATTQPVDAMQRAAALMQQVFPGGGDFQLQVWTNKGANSVYTEGEKLLVNILADRSAYLQVDYYQADGQVMHLLPNALEPNDIKSGQVFTLGKSDKTFQFEITPPFGVEMLTVLASQGPLETQRGMPNVELATPYLERLENRLKTYKTRGKAAVAYLQIRTHKGLPTRLSQTATP
jgi:type II secretory pathway predicted ATPase ExeA